MFERYVGCQGFDNLQQMKIVFEDIHVPLKPKTICTFTGCHAYAVEAGRCSKHTKQKFTGFNRAGESKQYHTRRWRKARLNYLKTNPLCKTCEAEGRTTAATVLDHIKPVNQGGEFWNADNWQGLCAQHHNIKSAKERKGRGV